MVTTARPQPAAVASASRADSSAACSPRQRRAGDDPIAQREIADLAGRGAILCGPAMTSRGSSPCQDAPWASAWAKPCRTMSSHEPGVS